MIEAFTVFFALATAPFVPRCRNPDPDPLAAARACRGDNACVTAALLEYQSRCLPFWRFPPRRISIDPPENVEPTPAVGPPRA